MGVKYAFYWSPAPSSEVIGLEIRDPGGKIVGLITGVDEDYPNKVYCEVSDDSDFARAVLSGSIPVFSVGSSVT